MCSSLRVSCRQHALLIQWRSSCKEDQTWSSESLNQRSVWWRRAADWPDASLLIKTNNDLLEMFCVTLDTGAQCCIEVRAFAKALRWCDEALKAYPTDKKLLELRAAADKHKVCQLTSRREAELQVPARCWLVRLRVARQRAADRDARKAKAKEKKLLHQKEALLAAINVSVCASVRPIDLFA